MSFWPKPTIFSDAEAKDDQSLQFTNSTPSYISTFNFVNMQLSLQFKRKSYHFSIDYGMNGVINGKYLVYWATENEK